MAVNEIVLGFDVGGTKTHAVLVDTKGEVLGQGFGSSGNINFVTLEQAENSFNDAITQAQDHAGIQHLKVAQVIIGIEPDPSPLFPFIQKTAGTHKILHKKEGECSLVGGLVETTGISLIAGTGSVGWGRNKKGETHVTSCWGTIGDEGSAYDIARRGVNAAFWATDGRGPQTKLVENLVHHFGMKNIYECVTPIYQNPDVRKNFSSLSRVVMKTAEQGDPVAVEVIREAANQIAHIITTCAEVLNMHTEPYRVAATGGLVCRGGWYFDLIQESIHQRHPDATMVLPKFEPALGAALIALMELGIEWSSQLVENMETSINRISQHKE